MKGEANAESDIDILVEFYPHASVSLLDFIELENYLTDLLNVKIELVEKSALKPRIGRNIQKFLEGVKRMNRIYGTS